MPDGWKRLHRHLLSCQQLSPQQTCKPSTTRVLHRTAPHTHQVSYHRDHVYLFDATGARKDSSTMSDPALSSYFMPTLPPQPSPRLSPSPPLATPDRPPSDTGGGSGNVDVGRGGSGGSVRVGTRRGPAESAGGTLEAADDATARVLVAHRALAVWDGRGGACVAGSQKASTLVWCCE